MMSQQAVNLLTPVSGMIRAEVEGVGSMGIEMDQDPLVMAAVQVTVFKTGEAICIGDLENEAHQLFDLVSYNSIEKVARFRKKT